MIHRARYFNHLSIDDALRALSVAGDMPRPAFANRPLFLYGEGKLGRLAQDYLKFVGRPVAGTFEGDWVAAWSDWNPQVAVCVVTLPYVPIEKKLLDRGFDEVAPFYDLIDGVDDRHPLINGWFAEPLSDLDLEKMAGVLKRWHDDGSRAHHLQFVAWRRLREEWLFAGFPVLGGASRPFIREIASVLHDRETFVDGGAYRGEVVERFVGLVGGNFDGLIAVEPDARNWQGLLDAVGSLCTSVLRCALSNEDRVVNFYGGFDYAGRLGPAGMTKVHARRIDSLGVAPTIVHLHLEGGELAALRGARETLIRCRPIVAASVEHNADGIWRTADYLMGLLPDYRFMLRNHCWCGASTMLYAVPKERYD